MIKALRLQKDEPLHEWVQRFCEHYQLSDEVTEGVYEISKQSYITGVITEREIVEKFKK